jgi:hypothetical protein
MLFVELRLGQHLDELRALRHESLNVLASDVRLACPFLSGRP